IRELREENLELERKCQRLQRGLQKAEDSLEKEVKYGQELNTALAEEKSRLEALNESMRQLQQEVKDREVQMVSQRHRLLSKTVEEEEYRNQIKASRKYVFWDGEDCTQNVELASEVEMIGQELEAAIAEVDRGSKEIETAKQIIANSDSIIDELTEERDVLKIKLEELSDQLHDQGITNTDEMRALKEDLEYYKVSLEVEFKSDL
ncbi:hypothetical protein HK405_000749, partial [Cladochytrium tenue]